MISHLGLIRTFLNRRFFSSVPFGKVKGFKIRWLLVIMTLQILNIENSELGDGIIFTCIWSIP